MKLFVMFELSGQLTPLFEAQLQRFAAESGCEVQSRETPIIEMTQAVNEGYAPGTAPDGLVGPSDLLSAVESLELSEIPEDVLAPNLRAETIDSVRVNGVLRGVPFVVGGHLFTFYNKRYAQPLADSIEEIIKTVVPQGITPVAFDFRTPYFFASYLSAFGGELLANGSPTLGTDAMEATLEFVRSTGDAFPTVSSVSGDALIKQFLEGKLAYNFDGDWHYADAVDALGDDVGAAPLPTIGGKRMQSFFSSVSLMFPAHGLDGPKRKVMLDLARFLQSEPQQREWADVTGRVPARTDCLAADRLNAKQRALIEHLAFAKSIPNDRAIHAVWDALHHYLPRWVDRTDNLNARATAEGMQAHAEDFIARRWGRT